MQVNFSELTECHILTNSKDQGAKWEAPDCSGSAQSPIDITGDFKHADHVPFERVNYDAAGNWTLVNSGYTIKMTPSSSEYVILPSLRLTPFGQLIGQLISFPAGINFIFLV
jgi:hypothetical protein